MIKATFKNNKIELYGTESKKEAVVQDCITSWNLKYGQNGRIVNFKNYADILNHLNKKGW